MAGGDPAMDKKLIGTAAAAFAAIAAAVVFLALREGPGPRRADGGPDQPAAGLGLEHEPWVEPVAPTASRPAAAAIRPSALVNRTGVAGRVVDEEGAGIAGAIVTAGAISTAGTSVEVRTDEAGRFETAGLEGPACDVIAEAPGFALRVLREVRLETGRAVEVTITLVPMPERLGRVFGPDGSPVPGAAVTIGFTRFGGLQAPSVIGASGDPDVSRTTDEHGWFSFSPPGMRATILRVRARKDGVGTGDVQTAAFERPFDVLEVRLRADPAPELSPFLQPLLSGENAAGAVGVVEGSVTDAAGRPVPFALVRAEYPPGAQASADENGLFRLLGVRAFALCRVGAARGRGPPTWVKYFDLAPGEIKTGVSIVLSAGPDLVVDAIGADGRRASGIVVTVDDGDSPDPAGTRVTARTDAAGRATFDAVPSTRVRVGVDPASLPPGVGLDQDENYTVFLLYGLQSPVVIRLRAEVVFRGQVVLEDGSPVAGGAMTFRTPETPRPMRPMQSPALFDPQTPAKYRDADCFARSNARGEFALRAKSVDAFEPGTIARVVRRPGTEPELQIFDPVVRKPLAADRVNVVVVRKRGG
jgi:hypothetical protein